MKDIIEVEGKKYKIITDFNEAFDLEEFKLRYTDYFENYDYIVGDVSYGKLRLKGFNSKKNENFNEINDFSKLDDYIKFNCAYGCKYFVLEKQQK